MLQYYLFPMQDESERSHVLKRLKEAVDIFVSNEKAYLLIPEIRTNIGYAVSNAINANDVAAIPGRLTVAFKKVIYCMLPAFGASDHIARVILTVMKYDKNLRSAINLKYYREVIEKLPTNDLCIFDRSSEPKEVKYKEHSTMNFMVEFCYGRLSKVPTYIVDLGDFGKEPSLFILDQDPVIVVNKSLGLLKYISEDVL
ncbi:phosphomethylpyrimidine kinase [Sulfolobus sp. E5-1-F]|uniref:thiamine-phosphate synthase family protein n=1 Tax=Sulfolobaceae TaxID=118883 RepID=UPI001295756A|nr:MULTISPECIES: thiamine-phosphate synthase family protein [unclassified Sulfolobus]QGA55535.1 phosphomethylpyrimidine kinase [Sulfolobus sp. E5-1-F]QGA67931.1 phosphomethylpyrimidine kinase [Sulfolobus sp. E11-6]